MIQVKLTRRKLLAAGSFVGGAFLAAASWQKTSSLLKPSTLDVWHDEKKLLVLDTQEAQLIEIIALAILPCGVTQRENNWPSAAQAEIVRRLDEELYFVDERIGQDFRLALKAVNALPLLYGRVQFFSMLSTEDQQAILRATELTRYDFIRAAVNACRTVINMMYFSHQASWQAMGYEGSFAKLPQQISAERAFYKTLIEVQS